MLVECELAAGRGDLGAMYIVQGSKEIGRKRCKEGYVSNNNNNGGV